MTALLLRDQETGDVTALTLVEDEKVAEAIASIDTDGRTIVQAKAPVTLDEMVELVRRSA